MLLLEPTDVLIRYVLIEGRGLLLKPGHSLAERTVTLQSDGKVDDVASLLSTEIQPEVLPGRDREGGVPVVAERGIVHQLRPTAPGHYGFDAQM